MEETTEEPVGLVERVCAIDIGKAELVACVRMPHPSKPGRRAQEVREYATMTSSLLGLADWLRQVHGQRAGGLGADVHGPGQSVGEEERGGQRADRPEQCRAHRRAPA